MFSQGSDDSRETAALGIETPAAHQSSATRNSGPPIYGPQRRAFRVSKQIEIVKSGSPQQAESSANNRIEEFEADGYDVVDQEVALGGSGMTILLVFDSGG